MDIKDLQNVLETLDPEFSFSLQDVPYKDLFFLPAEMFKDIEECEFSGVGNLDRQHIWKPSKRNMFWNYRSTIKNLDGNLR